MLPVNFEDSRTIDLCLMHRVEGTEHFHSLRTTRWPTVRTSSRDVLQERTHLVICPNTFVFHPRRTFLSNHTPAETNSILSFPRRYLGDISSRSAHLCDSRIRTSLYKDCVSSSVQLNEEYLFCKHSRQERSVV